MKTIAKQPWLGNASLELTFIILPALVPCLLLWLFRGYFDSHTIVTDGWWLLLVLGIDVSHVYSTSFRFFWEPTLLRRFQPHLIAIPVAALLLGIMLHSVSAHVFWRVMAYTAVFHFVRQQYGFVRLYSRTETSKASKWIDAVSIYAATLYPLVYWHVHRTDQLSWFVPGDFVTINITDTRILWYLNGLIVCIYLVKELLLSIQKGSVNIPKNGIMLGTFVSWYIGIVLANGDLTFTLLNVVAHGVPYMALVWLYGHRAPNPQRVSVPWKDGLMFLGVLLALAYLEEGLWDMFIWKDHRALFPVWQDLPQPPAWLVSVLVPLLSLPQITHYILDGFIWKRELPQPTLLDN
ncbi:MAG: hypothetical protein ACKOE6_00920 [Flammeovirgaceae bacterium]